jgi:tetratricopeptide (TPR) repeat protein
VSARLRHLIACALIVGGFAAPAAAQSKDERATALLGLARVKRDSGDTDAARRYFDDAAALRPLALPEREEYFWIVAGRDRITAVATGRAILAVAPGRSAVRDRLITDLLAQGDESSIAALAADGERLEPAVALWPRRLGQSALRAGQADIAIAAFERALHRTGTLPEDEDGRLRATELRERSLPQVQLRRDIDQARQSGALRQAVAAAEKLAATPEATAADRLMLVGLMIEARDPRAPKSVQTWIDRNGCGEQALTLADRLRDPDGTDLIVRLLNTPGCPADSRWIERGIERTVASGKHDAARSLIARLPPAVAKRPAMQRLAGQLALWTGHPADAIATLETVVKQTPTDRDARTALVDAYCVVARSHLAAGRPAEAFRLLDALSPAEFDPSSALALLDSAMATTGPADALASSRRITADKPEWHDVVARQYLIEAVAGDPARARARRSLLAGWDPQRASQADDEVLGAAEKLMGSAAAVDVRNRIESIASSMPPSAGRTSLLARVRASAGDHAGAIDALGPSSTWDQLPIDIRRIAADSLRALGRPRDAINVLRDSPESPADASLLAELHASIGRAALAAGQRDIAQRSAERAVSIDPSRTDVWLMLAELVADEGAGGLARLTERAAPPNAVAAFHLARARSAAAAEEWTSALESLRACLQIEPGNLPALRFQADVLSWSGHHAEGIAAYEAYLLRQPEDLDAARQQARVMGWAGRYSESKRRYAQLIAAHPADKSLAAEAAAKSAFFDGRFLAAADAYGRWLVLEPDNGEAAFERAESLRAAGRTAQADIALRDVAASAHHQLASQAWDRVQATRQPGVAVLTESKSTNGYDGQRLLDVQGAGGSVNATFRNGLATVAGDASYVRLTGGTAAEHGFRVGASGSADVSASVNVRGQARVWSLDNGAGAMPEFLARIDWRAADRWIIGTGGDRSIMFENLDTVDRQLAATGAFGTARFDSPRTTLDANVGWHQLSDRNQRVRATMTYGHQLSERLPDVRMLVWAESLNFQDASPDYYSPAHQVRVDAGLQYTHDFRVPKFRQDIRKSVTLGYLAGTDRDGVFYQHPTVNATFGFANGLALVFRGDWIRSDVYNEQSVSLHITATPGARR